MRASLVAPLALATLGVFAAAPAAAGELSTPVGSTALPNTTPLCASAVSVSGILDQTVNLSQASHPVQHWAAPGDTVQITGAGFSQPGCAVTVAIGDATPITPASNSGTGLTFAAPAFSATSTPPNTKGLNGPVTVRLTDSLGNVASSNSNYHFLEQPSASLSQARPSEGSTEALSGFGLNSGGDPVSISGTYTDCPGPGAVSEAATVSSDTQGSLPVPTTYCDGPVALAVTDPHYDSTANATDDAPITVSASAGSVDIPAAVGSVSPRSASPGSFITIVGNGFGPAGTASLAGVPAPTGWSDHEVIVQAPSGAPSGTLVLTRSTGDHAAISAGTISITPSASGSGPVWTYPTVAGGSITVPPTLAASANGPTLFTVPYGSVPPSHARLQQAVSAPLNSPDRLVIATANNRDQGTVGSVVNLVITLLIQNKPAPGALVSVSIVSSPGSDAKIKPAQGYTDSNGQFHARLRLSHLVGDHLVLARSGQFADEVHVLANAQTAGAAIKLPFGSINVSGNPLVVWLSVACFALILLGVVVNLNVMRRFVWSFTGGRVLRWIFRRPASGTPTS